MSQGFRAADEFVHPAAADEEWTFSWWAADGSIAGRTMYRLVPGNRVWYCFGLLRRDCPILHVAEFDIGRRSDPMIAKAESFWAELVCDAPFEQWTLGNETYAVELDDPDEGLGRAYGRVVPVAVDLEWYASGPPRALEEDSVRELRGSVIGYEQDGLLIGTIETDRGRIDVPEIAAHRSHRWSLSATVNDSVPVTTLAPRTPPLTDAAGRPLRLAFRLPDDSVWDAVLTAVGFRHR